MSPMPGPDHLFKTPARLAIKRMESVRFRCKASPQPEITRARAALCAWHPIPNPLLAHPRRNLEQVLSTSCIEASQFFTSRPEPLAHFALILRINELGEKDSIFLLPSLTVSS
ncbi:hypothetical protein EII20_11760 [Comamonadaceae bacterium OH2545_COT-014]|nr:hypothetical protein EII20_11760 [Comamonadaceae bacterium OH2545_COT-014]